MSSATVRHRNDANRPRRLGSLTRRLMTWFAVNARDLPWRRTTDPYAIWVAEIMLQQTQVTTVIPYWERWMEALPTIAALARARSTRVLKLWEGLGYYSRAHNLQRAAQVILREHQGEFPGKYEDVLNLPGIGRYTAGAICSIAFNQPTALLDGNVMRVLTRWFAIPGDPRQGETNERLWHLAQALVERATQTHLLEAEARITHLAGIQGNCSMFNQGLMELGALICTPRQPKCPECPVATFCAAYRSGRPEGFPTEKRRLIATARKVTAFILEQQGRILLRQRPEGVVNSHFWELPNIEGPEPPHVLAGKLFGVAPPDLIPAGTVRHTITRYRIQMDGYRLPLEMQVPPTGPNERWATPTEIKRLPIVSAHRKLLRLQKKL